jgi:hypothetical protein
MSSDAVSEDAVKPEPDGCNIFGPKVTLEPDTVFNNIFIVCGFCTLVAVMCVVPVGTPNTKKLAALTSIDAVEDAILMLTKFPLSEPVIPKLPVICAEPV